MTRWLIFHLPDLASAMIAMGLGWPLPLAGRVRYTSSAGWSRGRSAHDWVTQGVIGQAPSGPR